VRSDPKHRQVPALLSELQIPEDRIPLPLTNTDKEQYINHGDLVGCANYYKLLFLCPIIYLSYFWCIKYQYINIYMKIGKRNGKRKNKGDSQLAGPGGISAQRARARAGGLAGPRRSGAAQADAVGVGPRVSERRGVTAWSGRRRGGEPVGLEAGVRDWEARGGPFIGARGGEGAIDGVHRQSRHGGDGGAQWRRRYGSGRGVMGWLGWRKGTKARGTNRAGERVLARRRGGGDRRRSHR
jgi:hypothetical protein